MVKTGRRTFAVKQLPGKALPTCSDCGQEMGVGTIAYFLARGRYCHNDPCTPEQVAAHNAGRPDWMKVQTGTETAVEIATTPEWLYEQVTVTREVADQLRKAGLCS